MRALVRAVMVLAVIGMTSGCFCERSGELFCFNPPPRTMDEGGAGFRLAGGEAQPYRDADDRILPVLFDGTDLVVTRGELRPWTRDPGRVEWRQTNGLFAHERPELRVSAGRYDAASGRLTAEFEIVRTGQTWMYDRDLVRKETGAEPVAPDRWVDTEQRWTGTLEATVARPDPLDPAPMVDVVFSGENRWSSRDTAGATAFTGTGTDPFTFVVRYRLTDWKD